MVKGRGRKLLFLAPLVLALAVVGFAAWLGWSAAGARWLLDAASRSLPGTLEVAGIEGRLADRLLLSGVTWRNPGLDIQVDQVELRWQPLGLLHGELGISRLAVAGVQVSQVPEPARPSRDHSGWPDWPQLSGWPTTLKVRVGQFLVERVEYLPGEGAPFHLDRVAGELRWRNGQLAWDDLALVMEQASVGGRLRVGFAPRQAKARLRLEPGNKPWPAATERIDIDLELAPAPEEHWGAGGIRLDWRRSEGRSLHLEAALSLDPEELVLDDLRARRGGREGQAAGQVRLAWNRPHSPIIVDLKVTDVDLEPEVGTPTRISGTLAGEISADGYRGRFDLANPGDRWQDLALAGSVVGDWRGLSLDDLSGAWLEGRVSGALKIDWQAVPTVEGRLRGRGLNPARLAKAWPGSLDLSVAGSLAFPPGEAVTARVRADLEPSRFLGRQVHGRLHGQYRQGQLDVQDLEFAGPGYRLTARGALADRLQVSLEAGDLGGLLPEASGAAEGRGWLRWRSQEGWSGVVSARGSRLTWREWRLEGLDMEGKWRTEEDEAFLRADLRELSRGSLRLDEGVAVLAGTVSRHRLELNANWPGGRAEARLAGGWRKKAWQGVMQGLEGSTEQAGRWQLASPVQLTLSGERLTWSPLELVGPAEGRLATSGRLDLTPLGGQVEASWKAFDLTWLSAWLPDLDVEGHSGGELTARWQSGELSELRASAEARGSWLRKGSRLDFSLARTRLAWDASGLKGAWRVELDGKGVLDGEMSSGQKASLALPERGRIAARWQDLDLSLLNPWLQRAYLEGTSAGRGSAAWQNDGRLDLDLESSASLTLETAEQSFALKTVKFDVHWHAEGLNAELSLSPESGGRIQCVARSDRPARLEWPQTGKISAHVAGIDLGLVQPWLPEGLEVDGRLAGTASGRWLKGWRFDLAGDASVAEGRAAWRSEKGEIVAPVEVARLDWTWRKASLQGAIRLKLAERGQLTGSLSLPLPAVLPLKLEAQGPLRGRMRGEFHEEGLLASFFPGLVQGTRGGVVLDLTLSGQWRAPRLAGTATVDGAGGYLPAAGIRLEDVALTARLGDGKIEIEKLQIKSGDGRLHGGGEVALDGVVPTHFRLELKGENFRAVNLPELQLSVSPDLELRGRGRNWRVTGKVAVPEALVRGPQGKAPVTSSPDLVIVDAPPEEKKGVPLTLAVRVAVTLGDHVLVKAQGIDARLTGEIEVEGPTLERLTGQGRVEVAEGHYAAYGVRLKITRGGLVFAGGPIDRPTLDVLAVRTVGEVEAGIRVTGTPRAPVVKLYSEPAMPDTDVLAYIVLGHPVGGDSGQAGLLMGAAATLLSQGESAVLQDRIKRQLGIDVLDVQSGNGDVTQSVVTVGKYLSPELYVSFGQSIFTNTSQVGLRYDLGRHWQVESTMGTESGVDLYYRITFD